MSFAVAQRSLALAAVALLAATVALVATNDERSSTGPGPTASPAAGDGWYEAVAGPRGAAADGKPSACGRKLTADLLGVAHRVLPCGAKLVIAYGGQEVTTEVVDHRLVRAGVQFELTIALARRLGIGGTQRIRWRYATGG